MRNFVRFFVGLENPDDLIRDLDDAWASLQDE
jgi:cystathionine beta-lyase/cystathionine gamma-synthase